MFHSASDPSKDYRQSNIPTAFIQKNLYSIQRPKWDIKSKFCCQASIQVLMLKPSYVHCHASNVFLKFSVLKQYLLRSTATACLYELNSVYTIYTVEHSAQDTLYCTVSRKHCTVLYPGYTVLYCIQKILHCTV